MSLKMWVLIGGMLFVVIVWVWIVFQSDAQGNIHWWQKGNYKWWKK